MVGKIFLRKIVCGDTSLWTIRSCRINMRAIVVGGDGNGIDEYYILLKIANNLFNLIPFVNFRFSCISSNI